VTTPQRTSRMVNDMAAKTTCLKTLARAAAALAAVFLAVQATPAQAQVAINGTWTTIGTPGTATSYAATYAKPTTGTNRIMLVSVMTEVTTASTGLTGMSATYGTTATQTATAWTRTYVPGASTIRTHFWFAYFTEAQIAAAGGTLTLTVSGLPANNPSAVYVAVFNNVNQTTPINAALENGAEASAATFQYGTTLAYQANSLIVAATGFRYGGTPSIAQPTGYTERFDNTVVTRDQFEMSDVQRATAGTEASTTAATPTGTVTRWGIAAVALNPVAGNTVTIGNGSAEPGNSSITSGGIGSIDAFTLQANSGTATLTNVTVALTNPTALANVFIHSTATCTGGTTYGTLASPGASAVISVTGLSATTTASGNIYVCGTAATVGASTLVTGNLSSMTASP
jgi:hypothetical protein